MVYESTPFRKRICKTRKEDYVLVASMDQIAGHIIGKDGEDTAAAYLESNRYVILERNARFGEYEIDLVTYDRAEDMIVFVEVKSRTNSSNAYPASTSVDKRKRRALRIAIERWTDEHEYDGAGRLDVVCVSGDRVVEHITDLGSDFY